jgi:hypothetical protein
VRPLADPNVSSDGHLGRQPEKLQEGDDARAGGERRERALAEREDQGRPEDDREPAPERLAQCASSARLAASPVG